MKNLSPFHTKALQLRRRAQRCVGLAEALSPFAPVGYAAAVRRGTGKADIFAGGLARTGGGGVPAGADTIFRVASVSKIFVAAACLRLCGEGKLPLDQDIAPVLGFAVGKRITLRQLLTHTASLDDTRAYDKAIAMRTLPPLASVLPESFLPFAPGTRFRYSNLGAGVAGMLVEVASGLSFDDYVRKAFFLPFGIDASFHPQRILRKASMADCYRVPGGALAYDAHAIARQPLEEGPSPQTHYAIPAGKLMISAPDLLLSLWRIMRQMPEMFVRQRRMGSVSGDAGRGLGLSFAPAGILGPRPMWGHQGVAYGALCEAWMDPGEDTACVLLMNGVRLGRVGPLYRAGQSGVMALLDHAPLAGVY